ncbi:TPA: hypothetical protein ACGO2X_000421 [Streptococcus suis]
MEVKKEAKTTYHHVRCSKEAYDQIVELANECDLTIATVSTSLLLYALNHAEVISTEKVVKESRLIIGGNYGGDNQPA